MNSLTRLVKLAVKPGVKVGQLRWPVKPSVKRRLNRPPWAIQGASLWLA
jgi:hypothetical protein